MKYRKLGRTDIEVSDICLGSMTWGTQNTEAEGHEQIDYAFDQGVNFIDTAEMYPVNPTSAETQGRTEKVIGSWLKASGKRDKAVIATKVSGEGVKWIRDGAPISPQTITEAVEGSLKRLQTDYIDLYQLHWPNRGSYHFRQSWTFDPSAQNKQNTRADIQACLECLKDLIDAGKIRTIGLSNESCWGTSQFLEIAAQHDLPRVVSIQNEYSLMQRLYDLDLAELSHHEDVGLLAFSPLAAGFLSGKYQGGVIPPGSRRSYVENLGGRYSAYTEGVVGEYLKVASKHGLDPCQMAIAFCLARPFMTSAIIGATAMDQLRTNVAASDVVLDDNVLADIHQVYRRYPVPM
ncbi:MAG: aldo/keto reductase [Hyphomicrobiales bacterium]|nr:aldo/keto reductase [Hyphomicrobiales bacterium]